MIEPGAGRAGVKSGHNVLPSPVLVKRRLSLAVLEPARPYQ